MRRLLLSGTAAGAASAFAFTALHHLLISDIWFSLGLMLAAGALSGLCLAWTYGILFDAPTARGWWLYNGVWVALLVLLGLTSFVVYEPVTTMAAVMAIIALIFGFAGIFHVVERRRFATLSTPSAGRRPTAGVGAPAP